MMIHPFSKSQQAQGLVEYAFILVLVAIVVIAVLFSLGSHTGSVFSNVNSSLSGVANGGGGQATSVAPTTIPTDVPTSTPVWTYSAPEHGVVNVPSGTHQIQYGANGQYFYQTFTGPITVGCNNATFGDPDYGTVKSCSIQ